MVDIFRANIVKEPLDSSWDTTLVALAIKLFGGMANDEPRRRWLFGDDNEEEHEQEQEVPEQEPD